MSPGTAIIQKPPSLISRSHFLNADMLSAHPAKLMKLLYRTHSFCLVLILLVAPISAQEGTIHYDRVVKIEIDLPPEMESMRDRIPTENTTKMVLQFNEFESSWQASAEQDEPRTREFGGGGKRMRMQRNRELNITYINHDEGQMTDQRDFMGRTFLIRDEQPVLAWKLTGEQSEFDGYVVHRATAMRDTSSVEAWFAPEIPLAVGPGPFGGLPGAILVLTVDEGRMIFTAKDIQIGSLEEGAIVVPDEGKEVTQEEFDEIVEEKRKEMEAQFGGRRGGARFIIRQ